MRIAVYFEDDDTYSEVWILDNKYDDKIQDHLANDRPDLIYDLLKEKGKKEDIKFDYWINIGGDFRMNMGGLKLKA